MGRPKPPDRFVRRTFLRGVGGLAAVLIPAACARQGPDQPHNLPTGTDVAAVPHDPVTLDAARFDAITACRQTAEQIEGPFYVDVGMIRRDITEGVPGQQLRLGLRVRDLDEGCTPIPEAVVEVWQADAAGLYSAIDTAEQGRPELGGVDSETALRGAQATDGDGIAEFETIHPGRYPGRTPHLHVKVHLDEQTALTSQLYFDDDLNDEVLGSGIYAERAGDEPVTSNRQDGFFATNLMLTVSQEGDELVGLHTLDISRP